MFSTLPNKKIQFPSQNYFIILSSANAFNLNQSRNLSSGNGLKSKGKMFQLKNLTRSESPLYKVAERLFTQKLNFSLHHTCSLDFPLPGDASTVAKQRNSIHYNINSLTLYSIDTHFHPSTTDNF